jgi:hypothetical protein
MRKTLIATGAGAAIALAAVMLPKSPEVTQESAQTAVEQGTQTLDQLGPVVSAYLLQVDCTYPPTVLPCRDEQLAERLIQQAGRTAVVLHDAMQTTHAPAWDQAAGQRAITAVHDSIASLHALTSTPAFTATAPPESAAIVARTANQVQALAQ